jgi:hypothetical protein
VKGEDPALRGEPREIGLDLHAELRRPLGGEEGIVDRDVVPVPHEAADHELADRRRAHDADGAAPETGIAVLDLAVEEPLLSAILPLGPEDVLRGERDHGEREIGDGHRVDGLRIGGEDTAFGRDRLAPETAAEVDDGLQLRHPGEVGGGEIGRPPAHENGVDPGRVIELRGGGRGFVVGLEQLAEGGPLGGTEREAHPQRIHEEGDAHHTSSPIVRSSCHESVAIPPPKAWVSTNVLERERPSRMVGSGRIMRGPPRRARGRSVPRAS